MFCPWRMVPLRQLCFLIRQWVLTRPPRSGGPERERTVASSQWGTALWIAARVSEITIIVVVDLP
eukprot:COSAG02_NODE_3802_length_6208_cov_214.622360_1_plen_64_part_10